MRCREILVRCREILLYLVAMTTGLVAQAAGPRLESVIPGVGQLGMEFSLKLRGEGFVDGARLLFYQPGLTCSKVHVESGTELVATISTTPGCSIGLHPFRIETRQGLSELKFVRIIPFPIRDEVEPNNSASDAQLVQPGTTISGVLESGDTDYFKLRLNQGDRLGAEVEGIRLAANLIDSKLEILAPDGRRVSQADDTSLGNLDPYLTFIAPADGEYVVVLSTSGSDGNENSRYVLHLGHFARPDFLYPLGGPVDQPIQVQVLGDTTARWEQTFNSSKVGTVEFWPERDGHISPTPIPFRISPYGNILEEEPNDASGELRESPALLPIAFNGVISQSGDRDLFRFQAEKGNVIEFSTFANRVGSLADTFIQILSADGTALTSGDDRAGLDSGLIWECPATGEYLLEVTDKQTAGGEKFVYRVEAQRFDPAVTAFFPRRENRSQAGQVVNVPQGNRVLGFVAVRRQRWSGQAGIDFPKLPEGVSAAYGHIREDEYLMPIVFEAAPDAALGAELLPVIARGEVRNRSILGDFEQPIDLVAASADRLYEGVTVKRLAMAVVESTPYRIRFEQPPAALPIDGSLELIVHVDRDKEFDRPVDVTIPFLPEWVDCPEKITIAAREQSGRFALRAHPQTVSCTWPTVAEAKPGIGAGPSRQERTAMATGMGGFGGSRSRRGGGGGNAGDHLVATQVLPLQIEESPITGKIGQLLATPGKDLQVKILLNVTGKIPSKLTASLVGLPARVSAETVEISAGDREVIFPVKLGDDAPLGKFENLICELSGDWDGHLVTYRIGRGGSLKIVLPSQLLVDESGRPLSPLEILRREEQQAGNVPSGSSR